MATDVRMGYCLDCGCRGRLERKGINHILHLLLTVFTAGLWGIIWILSAVVRQPWYCANCGSPTIVTNERKIAQFEDEDGEED